MESKRQQKVARLIQRELAEIFQADTKGMFEGKFITVTLVRISPDLSVAKIYVSFLNEKDKKSALADLEEKHKYIKSELVRRIGKQIRIMPELHFFLDDTAEYASQIENLFQKIEIPPADKDYKIEGYEVEKDDLENL
ncbi:30S ribosome-binding factor RbfA [Raineya orbicola]|jgi:ribosome-binding factor A|uniref:Ribosome-binding factor A n=1 Tax=Raineya orbicola TaxID=2016530 RepID=A0A2N3I7L2_9BACT|nr:30S ribosome-binding factor RbfA [Raineya orbicola]PKQ66324.1 rbfA: ribosome-binding factor A [Raineya orbicola]